MPVASRYLEDHVQPQLDCFLVCGLGSLGQHCVFALKEFEVKIIAIEQIPNQNWEIPNLSALLTHLIIGDCRQNQILEQAKIKECRAALLVTGDEQVNLETALAVRKLNPQTRLVVRSAQTNLNYLLSQQLGNFIAFEPTELPASAFTLAALGSEILGFFDLDGKRIQVRQRQINSSDRWCNVRHLYELDTHQRKIIAHRCNSVSEPPSFYHWNREQIVGNGDRVVYLEHIDQSDLHSQPIEQKRQKIRFKLTWLTPQSVFAWLVRFCLHLPIRQIALVYSGIVLLLLLSGTLLFHWYYPQISLISAFLAAATLLLGGYGDLFSDFAETVPIPWEIKLFSLGLTVAGTIFVGVLYALLTEALLSSRFELAKPRFSFPRNNYVVVIGLGRVGQKVITLLQQFQQSLVGIHLHSQSSSPPLLSIPVIAGKLTETLPQANLAQAKSMVIVTDDEILNLEVALMARTINPSLHLVIRTAGRRLCQHLTELLPNAQIIGVYAVAAEAFAGAAFGENILSLFRLNKQTILVTEYQIEAEDTLHDLLTADLAYGYEVIPILYQKPAHPSIFFPSDELKLAIGDRLVVLATIEGLRRIEQGQLNLDHKCWQIRIEQALTPDAVFEGANLIVRFTGCSLALARQTMNNLPQTLPVFLYQPQAQKLVRELHKTLVKASVI